MQDAVFVAELDSLQNLVHEGFDGDIVELTTATSRIHVFLQILIHIFEYEHQFIFGVDDVVQRDDVIMFEFLHQGNLADGGAWGAFFRVEMDLFEGHQLAGLAIAAFKYLEEYHSQIEDQGHRRTVT